MAGRERRDESSSLQLDASGLWQQLDDSVDKDGDDLVDHVSKTMNGVLVYVSVTLPFCLSVTDAVP